MMDAARKKGIRHGDDARLIKALLLNGADKLAGWHKGNCGPDDDHQSPLDSQQGAGLLNVWNSYRQFDGGQHEEDRMRGNVGWDYAKATDRKRRCIQNSMSAASYIPPVRF